MLAVTTASEIFRLRFNNMRSEFRSKMLLLRKWHRNLIKSCRWSNNNRFSKDSLNRPFKDNLYIHSSLHTSQFPTPTQASQAWTLSFRTRQPRTSDTIRVLWEANKLNSSKRIIRYTARSIHSLGPYLRPVEALESSTSAIIAVLF
jgi:hypothetical protein